HQLAIRFLSGNMSVFVDGVFINSTLNSPSGLIGLPFHIGGSPWNSDVYFNGTIDDVMIFNRSLSAEEISALYANQSTRYLEKNFTGLSDSTHSFKAYTQDMAGNVNATELRTVTVNTLPPGFSNNQTSAPGKINEYVWFYVNWSDDNGLSSYIFSWNGTNGTWMNDTAVSFTGIVNQSNVTKTINLTRGNSIGWRFYANDSADQWNKTDIWTFTVENTAPTEVNLSYPLNQSSTTDRTPFFNWTASYDADGDAINYSIIIYENYCDISTYPNECIVNTITEDDIDAGNYTSAELGIDAHYNWTVRAYDGYNYSDWAEQHNFTIDSLISLRLDCLHCNDVVDFGTVYHNIGYNTTQDSPRPLILENNGNVFADIEMNASASLWATAGLDSQYFQFKAGNFSDQSSLNWSNSTTDWSYVSSNYTTAVSYLDYSNASNASTAEIELYIRVPSDEGAGKKSTSLNIKARYWDES
ncbi:hypothetical protein GF323_00750, partial [Candidatus Woesearchaeota archaeon]|nr:hypothetical protein [Candidatus Woesearchaeota archaeon]